MRIKSSTVETQHLGGAGLRKGEHCITCGGHTSALGCAELGELAGKTGTGDRRKPYAISPHLMSVLRGEAYVPFRLSSARFALIAAASDQANLALLSHELGHE